MIKSRKDLLRYIELDVKASGNNIGILIFFYRPVLRFLCLMRINEFLLNNNVHLLLRLIPLLWYRRLSIRLGFSIPLNVFDSGLAIVHYGLIVVNPNAKVGRNCRIHSGVNIGGSAGLVDESITEFLAPIIGDNCYIGPGAKIFGQVFIGNNCVIGANAVVNKNYPNDNVTIAGVPAKIISNKSSMGYLYNVEE